MRSFLLHQQPKFPGVTIDRAIIFEPHVAAVNEAPINRFPDSNSSRDAHGHTLDSRGSPSNHPPRSRPANNLHLRLGYSGNERWWSRTCGDPADSNILHGRSSRRLEWATAYHPEHTLTICTDSQSLLKAIERQSPVTHHLSWILNAPPDPNTLLWIPGHKGIPGNELAKEPLQPSMELLGPPNASTRSITRRTLIVTPLTNLRTAEVYGGFSWSKDGMATTKLVDACTLRACEPATLYCWKPTPTSSTLPQSLRVLFAKRSLRPSRQLGRTYHQPWKGAAVRRVTLG